MTLVTFVIKALSVATLLANIFIALAAIYLLFFQKIKHSAIDYINKNGIMLAFVVALVSTLGSLFLSEIAGFNPCELCWFQRIFMYPLVLLLGIALFKKDRSIVDYVLSLSIVGLAFSLYHNYIYYGQALNPFCAAAGKGASCLTKYMVEFGYITIPLMSLTGFLLIIIFSLAVKKQSIAKI